MLRNTIFSNKKVTFKKLFKLIEYFACRRTAGDCEQTININNTSIKEFYLLLRASVFKFLSHFSTPFGSQVVNIHVDETPITRRHGGIGRTFSSNTVWVIGAVDIFNKKCVLQFLPSRGRCHIEPFFDAWIARGSTVTIDYLATYSFLNRQGFRHYTVNHSKDLVSSNGIHTNYIEGIFGSVKKLMRGYNFRYIDSKNLNLFLAEWS